MKFARHSPCPPAALIALVGCSLPPSAPSHVARIQSPGWNAEAQGQALPAQQESPLGPVGAAQSTQPSTAPAAKGSGPDPLAALEQATLNLARQLRSTVVNISTYARLPAGSEAASDGWILRPSSEYPGFGLVASGSGVVVSKEGDILTNRHLLLTPQGQPVDLVDVETADLRHTLAEVMGLEPTLNLGVLQLRVFSPDNPPRFEPIPFGDSSKAEVGQLAFALGDPFGPEFLFSQGLISATPGRDCYQEQLSAAYLQASLPMLAGGFGGALVNRRGEWIGLLSFVPSLGIPEQDFAQQGLAYALPANIVQALYSTIKKQQSFRSPWLGWAVMSPAELYRERGAEALKSMQLPRVGIFIENVFAGSPADQAGIQPGDFLCRLGEAYIADPLDFQKQLYLAGIGSSVECEFFRNGEVFNRTLTITERPKEAITR
jgi:S1-C subfamily serine protease